MPQAFRPSDCLIPSTIPSAIPSGSAICNRYFITEFIGSGAMGNVYKANQVSMGRPVALKLLKEGKNASHNSSLRFLREMKVASKISHANTVQVYDFGEADDGQLFMAFEYIDGKPLGDILEKAGTLPISRVIEIGIQVAQALSAIHKAGVVHRDLKPQNIMISQDDDDSVLVKVLDFGVAAFTDNIHTQITHDGALVGSPMYMAPEQLRGKPVDHRSDLHSFGAILYQMLTGELPFVSQNIIGLVYQHAEVVPDAPSTKSSTAIPPELDQLVLDLISRNPNHRPQNADEVVRQFEKIDSLLTLDGGNTKIPTPAAPAFQVPRKRLGASSILFACVSALAILGSTTVLNKTTTPNLTKPIMKFFETHNAPVPPESCFVNGGKDKYLNQVALKLEQPEHSTAKESHNLLYNLLQNQKQFRNNFLYWTFRTKVAFVGKASPTVIINNARKAVKLCPQSTFAHHLLASAYQLKPD